MPETPDFEQLARHLHHLIAPLPRSVGEQEIVEQLRLMWNARGAADMATIEHDLSTLMGTTAAGPYLKNLDRALRKLDR
jgi:hypothetical protein